ncbi:MAG: regulatory protein GemA [Bacteroidales bacterium]|nr:regulatory protein GemA [Bacteroidales bacterium]
MKKTIIEKQEKQLRAKLHVLKTQAGMTDDEYRAMLAGGFGVDSSVDLNAHQLIDLIYTLEKRANPEISELDRWRKRVIAAVAGYLKVSGIESNIDKIKAIACRASGCDSFNAIPKQDLISVYYTFKNKQKVYKNVEDIISDIPRNMTMSARVYA